jgi:hypothetical protein
MQQALHYFLHIGFPLVIAFVFFKKQPGRAYVVMLLTMLVDMDHLLATPIYDASRCSIGFHPLHRHWAIGFYFILLIFPKSRLVAIGLLLHMATDALDCYLNFN